MSGDDADVPNEKTVAAFQELESGGGEIIKIGTAEWARQLVEGWAERRRASFERLRKNPRFLAYVHRKEK